MTDPKQDTGLGEVRVLIADERRDAREGLRALLKESGFNVVSEVGDAESAVEEALDKKPQLCLLDMSLAGGGIAAAWRISSSLPETEVVMLSGSDEGEDFLAALRAGVSGYMLRNANPQRLPMALKGVLSGEAAVPRKLVRRLLGEFRRGRRAAYSSGDDSVSFTHREWVLIDLMKKEFTTKEIADQLFVSTATVRAYADGIMRKLGASDLEEMLRVLRDLR